MREMLNELITSWNTRDVERMVLYYADNYEGTDIGLARTFHGIAGMRQMTNFYYSAFPDLSFTLMQTIAQVDCAALVWVACGTHQGRIMNIPATGRSVKINGITTLDIQNGLIIRSSVLWDVAGLLRNIGLLPDL